MNGVTHFPEIFFSNQDENDFCKGEFNFTVTTRDFPKPAHEEGEKLVKKKERDEPNLKPILEQIMKLLGIRRKLSAALTFMMNVNSKIEEDDAVLGYYTN